MASKNTNDCDPIELVATQALEVVQLVEVASEPTYYGGTTDIRSDDMTLSIDHIREKLFSSMTPEDLFSCRQLNRNWNSYATDELQERFEVKCTIKKETLEEYLNLLQKHQEIFPFLPLPVFRKYSFEKVTSDILSDPVLQKFLKTYGDFIRGLSLHQQGLCFYSKDLPKENDLLKQVHSLLIHSTPNLSSLRMCGMVLKDDAWEDLKNKLFCRSQENQDSTRLLETVDPKFEEIQPLFPETDKNENLKFFSFNPISGKMFELAIQLAPNLEEIQIQSNDENDNKYFIEPFNRLRLCKEMRYSADSSDLLKVFGDLAHEGELKLRQISFMFGREDPIYGIPSCPPVFFDRYDDGDVDAINTILSCSWDSLETIKWRWMKPVPGLKWPEVMPNVSRIDLGPHHHALEDGLLVFPPDFSWSATFPKLRELEFCVAIESRGFPVMLQCFKSQCIDSVEEVRVLEKKYLKNFEELERDAITLANLELLRRLFPSAQVLSTYTYCDSDSDSDEDLSP